MEMVQKPDEVILTPPALAEPFCQLLSSDDCFQATTHSEVLPQDLIHDGPATGRGGNGVMR
jgi:hypothetical protein